MNENLVVAGPWSDDEYELVINAGRPTYDWIEPHRFWGDYSTRNFITHLRADQWFWNDVLRRLGGFGAHLRDPIDGIVSYAHSAFLKFYKLPHLSYRYGVPSPGERIGFMRGPKPLRKRREWVHEPIESLAKAQALVHSLNFSVTSLYRVFSQGGYKRMSWFHPERLTKETLIEMLVTKEMLAYTLYNFSLPRLEDAPRANTRSAGAKSVGASSPSPPSSIDSTRKTNFSARKGVPPASMEEGVERLRSMRKQIDNNGYQAKYTDTERHAQAAEGTVAKERYHVRFMEYSYLERGGKAGMMGKAMQGASGKGAKYWSTTFDQLEDCDLMAELIAKRVGLPDYSPKKEYVMIIIDTQATEPLAGTKAIVPTFANLGAFAKEELPDDFPPEVTDKIMTREFQDLYAEHYQRAEKAGVSMNDEEKFSDYLASQKLDPTEEKALKARFKMHNTLGNNSEYEGTGLTKNLLADGQKTGVVETFNFERKEIDLDQMVLAKAIYPIKVS